jgi:Cohesin domain/PEP-CTERM motif
MKMKWTLGSCLVGLALLLLPQQGQALTFSVDSATVNVGDRFSINVHVADAVDLTSWQFNLGYNPTILQALLVTEGPFLADAGTTIFPATMFIPGVIDNSTGLISVVANSFIDIGPPFPTGSGVLATIRFKALIAGLSPLMLSSTYLNGLDTGFTVTNGSVCVNGATSCNAAVPEPGSILLLSLGGIVFWGMRRWSQDGAAAIL